MKSTFKVSLKANERIYVNGAVIKVDRKTSIEFLNDVNFLLENHILQYNNANTPLKELYYLVQLMLMAPNEVDIVINLFKSRIYSLISELSDERITTELKNVDRLVHEKYFFEAMKNIRELYQIEHNILGQNITVSPVIPASADASLMPSDRRPDALIGGR